jgi:hypothetical protein
MQSVPTWLIQVASRVLPWTLRHPFVLHPASWTLLLAAWIGVAFFLVVGSVLTMTAVVVLVVLLAAILLALYGWRRLLRASELFLVFLSRFATAAPQHEVNAVTQALQIRRRLEGCQPLASAAELRSIHTSLTRADADRVMEVSAAQAVVFGSLLIAANEMEVTVEVLRRRPAADPRDRTPVPSSRRNNRATVHRTFTDPGIPLVHLVRGPLTDAYALWIEQELLASLANYQGPV